MSSHLLLEGILDVKDPRGSEDRKFWKAWRRAWISLAVVYPLGRGSEPYLQLNLSHGSPEDQVKKVKISRNGLRLFRCRSKSRPYRTWAMASGNKVVLYFAAESEVEGQNWMQTVRDGLWPPCFSFQMLSDACSQEVSLIDDDNTFMSGLLGVYGRFVLTSEDIISLMHPHWGATLLEISLRNIRDVLFVREAEIPLAGVFSILLKRVEGSKVKALQFFCSAAKEVMKWILSKMDAKNLKENKISSSKDFLSEKEIPVNSDNKITSPLNVKSTFISGGGTSEVDNNTASEVNEYENIQYLKLNSHFSETSIINKHNLLDTAGGEYGKVDKRASVEFISESNFQQRTTEGELSKNIQNTSPEHHIYVNVVLDSNNTQNKYEHAKLNDKVASSPTSLNSIPHCMTNPTVNKNILCKSSNCIPKTQVTSQLLSNEEETKKENMPKFNMTNTLEDTDVSTNSSKINCEELKISSVFTTNENPTVNKLQHDIFEAPSIDSASRDNIILYSNSQLYSTVNKNSKKLSNEHIQNVEMSIKKSLNDYRNSKVDKPRLLPNIPSEFLDTSLNFVEMEEKIQRRRSSAEDDTDISILIEDGGLRSNEHLYEDILDRKGTIYEEIDASGDDDDDNDDESPEYILPELPKRPENLEIPDSLRLQKLSKSITQTLKVIENPETNKKEFPRTKFIKKIRDTSRIMQISPTKEHAKESFAVDSKTILD